MPIIFDEKQMMWNLIAKDTSYIIHVNALGYLAHVYWGKKITEPSVRNLLNHGARPGNYGSEEKSDQYYLLDSLPQEYPSYGDSDFRSPAFESYYRDGSSLTTLKYKSFEIIKGKKPLHGLPATYVEDSSEAQTLFITVSDEKTGLTVVLSYTAYEEYDVITRNARIDNNSGEPIRIQRALSMSVDMDETGFDVITLHGTYCRERSIERVPMQHGEFSISSALGSSGHYSNPFLALSTKNADEETGRVYAFSFVYSGNFLMSASVSQRNMTRVSAGINPLDFSWLLEAGESFQTPETVMVFSDQGLGKMSRTFHRLYRKRLCRGKYRDAERPVLTNTWEAVYFGIDTEKLLSIAETAQKVGIELFVLDDGWFGSRDDDMRSLGDWYVDRKKLPQGLKPLTDAVQEKGMQFGLWFEPEMVNPDSDLYREHPDWCIHVQDRKKTLIRNQLMLDFSRDEVCGNITSQITEILKSVPVRYVKWDYNRYMTQTGSAALPPERQRETAHRYMLNVYRMMDTLTARFPDILFEGCAAGGGRFDPGILYYMPQIWASDNTNAASRIRIQYGTSLVYPAVTMGAHLSYHPWCEKNSLMSLDMRCKVAMSGNFGCELDLSLLDEEDKELVKKQIAYYKSIRHLVQFGDLYRLVSPFESNHASWMFVSEDKMEAVVFYFVLIGEYSMPGIRVKLQGLDGRTTYRVENGEVYTGEELMYSGLQIDYGSSPFLGFCFQLHAAEE